MDRLMEEWIQKTKKDLQILAGLLIINSVARRGIEPYLHQSIYQLFTNLLFPYSPNNSLV